MPASPEAWRCFVAVPLPPDLRSALEAVVAGWRAEPGAPDLRWTDPGGWHVTLAFLGATDPAEVPGLASRLGSAIAGSAPFVVRTAAFGAFPRAASAQTVWLGIEDPHGRLAELAEAVQQVVLPAGAKRGLEAHLTLGRSRVRRGEPLGPWLSSRTFPRTELPVADAVLFRSHLRRGPPRYEELARYALSGAGSARG